MKSSIVVIIYYFGLISKFGLMGNRMLPNPFRHRTSQHFVAGTLDPYHVQMDGKYGMRAMAIIVHEASCSKRGCSSFRLKVGVLPFPIGDNKNHKRF
jgi:hypothetical protein